MTPEERTRVDRIERAWRFVGTPESSQLLEAQKAIAYLLDQLTVRLREREAAVKAYQFQAAYAKRLEHLADTCLYEREPSQPMLDDLHAHRQMAKARADELTALGIIP